MDYKTGTLIEFRNRPWVVQQSGEDELMIIKPLGGRIPTEKKLFDWAKEAEERGAGEILFGR